MLIKEKRFDCAKQLIESRKVRGNAWKNKSLVRQIKQASKQGDEAIKALRTQSDVKKDDKQGKHYSYNVPVEKLDNLLSLFQKQFDLAEELARCLTKSFSRDPSHENSWRDFQTKGE